MNIRSETVTTFEDPKLMVFSKVNENGIKHTAYLDIINGEFIYEGDVPISDAARILFEMLSQNCGKWWIERAAGIENNNCAET